MITNKWSPGFYCRSRDVCRVGGCSDRDHGMVVQSTWPGQPTVIQHHRRIVDQHTAVQRQSLVALRRLLHFVDILEIPNLRQNRLPFCSDGWVACSWESRHGPTLFYQPETCGFLPATVSQPSLSLADYVFDFLGFFTKYWNLMAPKIIGQMIALLAVWSLLGVPLLKLYKYFSIPGRWDTVKPIRGAITMILTAGVLGAFLLIPIPHYVHCFLCSAS